jgi:predicted nucleic acid-binding protein
MVLELAVEGSAKYIVTFNLKDFAGIDEFGVSAVTPQEFLHKIEERQ